MLVTLTGTCHTLSNAYIFPFPVFPHFDPTDQVAIYYGEVTLVFCPVCSALRKCKSYHFACNRHPLSCAFLYTVVGNGINFVSLSALCYVSNRKPLHLTTPDSQAGTTLQNFKLAAEFS
jgi:hypothetical protein